MKLKLLPVFLLSFLFLFPTGSFLYAQTAFTDIEGHWASDAITFVLDKELFYGISDTEFGPEQFVTRGMFVTILGRMAHADAQPVTNFIDVMETDYYAAYVAWAVDKGITKGVSSTLFAPNDFITREQLAVMLYQYARVMNIDTSNIEGMGIYEFTDYDTISNWAIKAIRYCVNAGLLSGRTNGSFDPKGPATRAETSVILQKFLIQ